MEIKLRRKQIPTVIERSRNDQRFVVAFIYKLLMMTDRDV
jgi:hypothetical protein